MRASAKFFGARLATRRALPREYFQASMSDPKRLGLMIPSLGILNKPCEQPGSDGPNGGLYPATKSTALAPSSSPSSSNSEQRTGSRSSLQNPSPPVISLPQSLPFLYACPQDAALQV